LSKYKYQTTQGQFARFETESRNSLELLYKVYLNETGNTIAIPKFQGLLRQWCMMQGQMNFPAAVENIKNFLTSKFAQKDKK
jgi:hypothetical protein